jgi:membrane protein required for beta-lactamase induction
MRFSFGFVTLWLSVVLAQKGSYPECTRDLAATDDCADVINANACYNQFRFKNAQTLTCIHGKDNNDKIRKVNNPLPPLVRKS